MRRIKIKNEEKLKRLTLSEAKKAFIRHCKIKNLSEKTIKYYTEDIFDQKLREETSLNMRKLKKCKFKKLYEKSCCICFLCVIQYKR